MSTTPLSTSRRTGDTQDDDRDNDYCLPAADPVVARRRRRRNEARRCTHVGGMVPSTILTLLVIPAVYSLSKEWEVAKG